MPATMAAATTKADRLEGITWRRSPIGADWKGSTVVIRDTSGVLYKPAGSGNDAFYEPDSRASTRRHLELFEELWRCSIENPELRPLSI